MTTETKEKTATVGMTELQKNLDRYMDMVENGYTIYITRYGKQVAVLVPYLEYQRMTQEIDELRNRLRD